MKWPDADEQPTVWPGPGSFRPPGPIGLTSHDTPRLDLSGAKVSAPGSSVWDELEKVLVQLYSLPHNLIELQGQGKSPTSAAREKVQEVKSGLGGSARRETFSGPKLFLRVLGATSRRAYRGEWWFDADLLNNLEASYSRIYFNSSDKKQAIRDMLRELLAISVEWNRIEEVWALVLPAGESISGFVGEGAPQKLFANLPLSAKGNRMLVGKARQIFFPVKNPLWIERYRDLGR
jgi:hypothetical protein